MRSSIPDGGSCAARTRRLVGNGSGAPGGRGAEPIGARSAHGGESAKERKWTPRAIRDTMPPFMSKARTVFVCQSCGFQSPRWLGPLSRLPGVEHPGRGARRPRRRAGRRSAGEAPRPQPITEVAAAAEPRSSSGIGELDRVLGGGVVPGSVVLIGGDPGIGKSTLVLQALAALARARRRCSTSPARSRRSRSRCAPIGSASPRTGCCCWPRPASRRS